VFLRGPWDVKEEAKKLGRLARGISRARHEKVVSSAVDDLRGPFRDNEEDGGLSFDFITSGNETSPWHRSGLPSEGER